VRAGAREVARLHLHVAQLVEGDGEVALGLGGVRVGLRQLLGMERAGEELAGAREVTRLHIDVAQLVEGDGEVALGLGGVRVGLRHSSRDLRERAKSSRARARLPACTSTSPSLFEEMERSRWARAECRVGFRQPLGCRSSGRSELAGAREVAGLHLHVTQCVEGEGEVALGLGAVRVGLRHSSRISRERAKRSRARARLPACTSTSPSVFKEMERSRWAWAE
jgi:hypothetical protein